MTASKPKTQKAIEQAVAADESIAATPAPDEVATEAPETPAPDEVALEAPETPAPDAGDGSSGTPAATESNAPADPRCKYPNCRRVPVTSGLCVPHWGSHAHLADQP